jgi:hypothetical protein
MIYNVQKPREHPAVSCGQRCIGYACRIAYCLSTAKAPAGIRDDFFRKVSSGKTAWIAAWASPNRSPRGMGYNRHAEKSLGRNEVYATNIPIDRMIILFNCCAKLQSFSSLKKSESIFLIA